MFHHLAFSERRVIVIAMTMPEVRVSVVSSERVPTVKQKQNPSKVKERRGKKKAVKRSERLCVRSSLPTPDAPGRVLQNRRSVVAPSPASLLPHRTHGGTVAAEAGAARVGLEVAPVVTAMSCVLRGGG